MCPIGLVGGIERDTAVIFKCLRNYHISHLKKYQKSSSPINILSPPKNIGSPKNNRSSKK